MGETLKQDEATLPLELAGRLRFETLMADLWARFINVPAEAVDAEIVAAQRRLCACLGVDVSSVWQFVPDEPDTLRLTHVHLPPGTPPVPDDRRATSLFPWVLSQIGAGHALVIADTANTPPEAVRDRETWRQYGIRSALALPLSAGGGPVFGVLSFDTVHQELNWPEALVARCRLVAHVFANALARKQSERRLRESEERYRTIALNLPGVVYQFRARDDGQWGMQYVDARAAEVCGLEPEPLDTFFDRFAACVAPEEREPWLASIEQAIRASSGWEQEVRFIKPDGQEVYLKGFSEPRRIGEEVVFSGVLRDTSRQRLAEEELRRTVEELRRLKEQLLHENVYLRKEIQAYQGQMPIVGNSDALRRVITQAHQVAVTDSTVLILGETGTGKELLASYLHRIGKRAAKPFVTTNVAAIPATLLESELFGREKGAYTGAMTRQAGRFELADGGTLFLDEIGEMPLETQAKLLRVLQSGTLERLGSSRTMRVDVQVIAATNRKLPELARAGTFRQDLFYRLNVFPITLPPLRDRPEDIPALVWAFVKEFSDRMGKPIDRIRKKDLDALQSHHWPGNVRELRNVVERSMILTAGPELRLVPPDSEDEHETSASRLLHDVERLHVLKVLESTAGKIRGPQGAAEILGLKPTTLYSLMERLGIERKK